PPQLPLKPRTLLALSLKRLAMRLRRDHCTAHRLFSLNPPALHLLNVQPLASAVLTELRFIQPGCLRKHRQLLRRTQPIFLPTTHTLFTLLRLQTPTIQRRNTLATLL